MSIPEIPGQVVDSRFLKELRLGVKELIGVSNFPGAQPISFTSEHLHDLLNENYFVCEKSDGTRVLVYITHDHKVYMIDRKNSYRYMPNLFFPIPGDPTFSRSHSDTLIDGELVKDFESDGKATLKLLAFDLLVIDGKRLTSRPLTSRLGHLSVNILKPYNNMLSSNPKLAQAQPFTIELKDMELSYGLDKVFNSIIPNLKHKNDGLIFTSSIAGYKSGGTNNKMLKWKPPNENSIDFKLHLDFSNIKVNGKPKFCLNVWKGDNNYHYFDEMYVTDDEWEKFWKNDCDKYEGMIVEVVNDFMSPGLPWKFSRFRSDKLHGNHYKVVEKIQQSIADGITEEQLCSHIPAIRDAWKRRAGEEDKHEKLENGNQIGSDKHVSRKGEEETKNINISKSLKHAHEDESENEDNNLENVENGNKDNKPKRLKLDHEESSDEL